MAGIVLAHNALPFQTLCHADGNSLITTLAVYDVVMTYPLGNHNSTATTISLLKTAITPISAKGLQIQGNILFDEDSQRSFITRRLLPNSK